MKRREFLKGMAHVPLMGATFPKLIPVPNGPAPLRVAFGSCLFQDRPMPIWDSIAALDPDLFIFMGDNIYGDTYDMKVMAAKYAMLENNADFKRFRARFPIVGTWDDHDFGGNDFGSEYPKKRESKALMLKFLREPAGSARWKRDGVYTSYIYGRKPHRTQVILMDLRWFRSALNDDKDPTTYLPEYDPKATMLGAAQWKWITQEFKKPAESRILVSSTQFLGADHRFEKWANMPLQKNRMLRLFDSLNLKNLVVVSGDMHFAELTRGVTPGGREVLDLTSSGLNRYQSSKPFPNSKRVHLYDEGPNFGLITLDWARQNIVMDLHKQNGTIAFSHEIPMQAVHVPGVSS